MGVERKLATVLFVDLVDSTGLVSTTDPEIVRRRVDRFFEQASECIEHHGGLVEKFAGDAVMAAFGVPQAHEDDAERAIRAALAILEATADLGLEARVGVEAGEVVVGDGDSTFATGEAINLAARLQQSAEPNQILIGPNAYRLTLDRIEVEDFGPVQVRGRDEPIWAWRAGWSWRGRAGAVHSLVSTATSRTCGSGWRTTARRPRPSRCRRPGSKCGRAARTHTSRTTCCTSTRSNGPRRSCSSRRSNGGA